MTKEGFIIYHKRYGVYLGSLNQRMVWSLRLPITDRAPAFRSITAAKRTLQFMGHIKLGAKVVKCEPDLPGNFASVYECVRCGLPAWLEGIPGTEATDKEWQIFLTKFVDASDLGSKPYAWKMD